MSAQPHDRMLGELVVSPLALKLRDYQRDAIDGVFAWFEKSTGNPLVIAPTGAGKSVIMTGFIHEVLRISPSERFLVLTHVRELIAQNHAALKRAWPGAPSGIASAGLGRRDYEAQVLFAGIQTVFKKAKEIQWVDLVLVDECHLIPKQGFGMYRTLLNDLLSINPKLKIIGLTATPFRTDCGRLDRGSNRIFEGIAYDCDLVSLIDAGYLSQIKSRGTEAKIDTAGLHVRAGEFIEKEVEERAMADDKPRRAVEEIIARAGDRKSWLIFCCSIKHAELVQTLLIDRGIECAAVFGSTPSEERDRILAEFKAGKLRAVVNMNVLTTGFDAPNIDLIVLLRATKSPGLYVQMVGRGLRIASGKTDCLVLDFGNNVARHGSLNNVRTIEPGDESDDGDQVELKTKSDVKECPSCRLIVVLEDKVCPECGYQFPEAPPEPKYNERPDEDVEIIDRGKVQRERFETWPVDRTTYARHRKEGKPDSLRVDYRCGYRRWISEWVCFEHGGIPRRKAEQWWREREGRMPVPDSVEIALDRLSYEKMRPAVEVVLDNSGEYPRIVKVKLGEIDAGLNEEPWTGGTGGDYDEIPF